MGPQTHRIKCTHYYSCITCGKSVCVKVECSIAEENDDTLRWEANKSVSYLEVLQVLSRIPYHEKELETSEALTETDGKENTLR